MSAAVRRKEINLIGGGTSATESLRIDMAATTKADIRAMMLSIVGSETAAQESLDNPPQITEVDNSKTKPVSQAQRKVVVLFGVQLTPSALRKVEGILMAAINASTEARSGKLSDPGNWEWRHIRNGRQVPIGSGPISFGPRDFLVLRPGRGITNGRGENYASAANKRVASGSRALNYNPAGSKRVAKRNQKLGFMALAARACRQVAELVPFSVTVGMTTALAAPGEVRKIGGTAYLRIAPRRRRMYRR